MFFLGEHTRYLLGMFFLVFKNSLLKISYSLLVATIQLRRQQQERKAMSKEVEKITVNKGIEAVDKNNRQALTSQDIENKDYIKEIKFNNFIDVLIEIITENNICEN